MRHVHPARAALTAALVLCALTGPVLGGVALANPAAAQDPAPTDASSDADDTRSTDVDSPLGEIIPKPNSGTAPQDAGDPGGTLQLTLFALVVLFLGLVGWRIAASARRARGGATPPSRPPRPRPGAPK